MFTQAPSEFETLEFWMDSLRSDVLYSLQEELSDGTIITHLKNADNISLWEYVEAIWLPDHPATLLICPLSHR